jgi:hypothetical protein
MLLVLYNPFCVGYCFDHRGESLDDPAVLIDHPPFTGEFLDFVIWQATPPAA